ncbi:acyl-CoA thioesterase [Streptococcus sp. DD13]|uniref:acyl-CoA thioesterase n=1 Tax=Streptococcus sp. DD13 TaxID=1777881 RepID=UPI00079255E1|nr:acyl-CoA thioesterase [Streptococcus sp. DD13]KXT78971.1 4-hydroxybenzoyl-CoA thioesterase family active site [Streptococcus sp. DD13]
MKDYLHQVQYYETDGMRIAHHSNYIRWMEEARIDFFQQIGWAYDRLEDTGVFCPIVSVEARYLGMTKFSDWVKIQVRCTKLSSVRITLDYEMRTVTDELVFRGRTENTFLRQDRTFIRLKSDLPELYQALEAILVD